MNTFASTVERGIATLHMHDAATSNAIDIGVARAIHRALVATFAINYPEET